MIEIENVLTPRPEMMMFVVQGLRNPMNSWDRSDSAMCDYGEDCDICKHDPVKCHEFYLGENDADLMKRLASAGTEHRKFMRMMLFSARITAPLYFWKEFDTYKVGTVSNSCSTMHKITEKEFSLDDFSHEHLQPEATDILEKTVDALNFWRKAYVNNYQDSDDVAWNCLTKKDIWWQMIQLLPSSYNQTRNVMMNYEVLANIYHQRKNHKLDEWVEFCKWIESIPYASLITESK